MTTRFINLTDSIMLQMDYEELSVTKSFVKIGDSQISINGLSDTYVEKDNLLLPSNLSNIRTPFSVYPTSFPISTYPNFTYSVNKITLHFVQNFVFDSPIYLDTIIQQKNSNSFSLNKLLLSDLTQVSFNSNVLVRNGKLYNLKYEFSVPSINYLILDWYRNGVSNLSLSNSIFGKFGISDNSIYEFRFGLCSNLIEQSDGLLACSKRYNYVAALPKKDTLQDLSASINESLDGDYLECGLDYIGGINTLISDFSTVGKSFYLTHEISILEFVPLDFRNPSVGDWVLTDTYSVSKVIGDFSNFSFRPILKRDDVSPMFKVQYVGKLIDASNGEETWKQATFASNKVRKYGKILPVLDFVKPQPILNIIETNQVNILAATTAQENFTITKTNLIPVWFNELEITVNNLSNVGSFVMPHFSSAYIVEFKIKDLDVTVFENLLLEFSDDDGRTVLCSQIKTTNSNLLGYVSFQVSIGECSIISTFKRKSVRIIANDVVLAFGVWQADNDYTNDSFISKFKTFESQILELKKQIENLKNRRRGNLNLGLKINPLEINNII